MTTIVNKAGNISNPQLNTTPAWTQALNQWVTTSPQDMDCKKYVAQKITAVIDDLQIYAEKKAHILDLSFLSLTELPPASVWTQLNGLNELDLSNNELSEKTLENLKPLSSLNSVNLDNNEQLNAIPLGFIAAQSNLNTFSACECGLTQFPVELAQSRQLTTLNISDNLISELPALFGSQMDNLSELDLKNNQLTSLPTTVKYLDNLTRVSLSGNPLIVVPSTSQFATAEHIEIEY